MSTALAPTPQALARKHDDPSHPLWAESRWPGFARELLQAFTYAQSVFDEEAFEQALPSPAAALAQVDEVLAKLAARLEGRREPRTASSGLRLAAAGGVQQTLSMALGEAGGAAADGLCAMRTAGDPGETSWTDYRGQPTTTAQALAEGEKNVQSMNRAALHYSETFDGGATISKASEHYITAGKGGLHSYINSKGGPFTNGVLDSGFLERVASTPRIVDGIRNAPAAEVFHRETGKRLPLFRGISGTKAIPEVEALRAGMETSMGRITSFSSERSGAAFYANDKFAYEFELRGSAKMLSGDGFRPHEHVTQGRFRVVEIKKGSKVDLGANYTGSTRYRRTIVLEQIGVH